MKNTVNKNEQSVSVLLFGAVLGTVTSTMLHTSRGKQLLHDAKVVFDDFVSLLEHTLDDDVSFEESIVGVQVFSDHVVDKLDRIDAFHTRQSPKVQTPQAQPILRTEPVMVNKKASETSHITVHSVRPQTPQPAMSAFMYHKPIEPKKSVPKQPVDDEIALLHQLGKQLFR